jgi:eukaryotic-like serine/threonine-protein kinase
MPLVRGGSVGTLLKRHGALPPRWVGLLVDQTLQALDAVHGAAIVHRDIKPGNLLLEPTGAGQPHLRLTDFGIAVPEDEPRLTAVAMAIGTPGYMAPEQRMGADPAPGADIYALGMVTLEMLTGERPPSDPVPLDLDALRTGDPQRDAVLQLVATMTRESLAERPAAAAMRAHPALQSLLALPPDPSEGITVPDEFATARDVPTQVGTPPPPPPPPAPTAAPTMAPAGASYPPPPPPAGPTRIDTMPGQAAARSGGTAAYVLLALGLIGLIASGWLFLGG